MNEVQRLEMIKQSRHLVKAGTLTQEEFEVIKKRVICEKPVFFQSPLGVIKKARKLLDEGVISSKEYDFVKKEFLADKVVYNFDNIGEYKDLHDRGAITDEEFVFLKGKLLTDPRFKLDFEMLDSIDKELESGTLRENEHKYLKARILSGARFNVNYQAMNAAQSAYRAKALSESEYESLRNAVVLNKAVPKPEMLNIMGKYTAVYKRGIITNAEYEIVRQRLLQNMSVPPVAEFWGLKSYKELLEQGAITQAEYNERKKTVMPEAPTTKYVFPSDEPIIPEDFITTDSLADMKESGSDDAQSETNEPRSRHLADVESLAEKEHQRQQEESERKKRKIRKILIIAAIVVLVPPIGILTGESIHNHIEYSNAIELGESGKYSEAIEKLHKLGDYKDSASYIDKFNKEREEAEKKALTESIRATYDKREEYIADMDTDGLCNGIIRPDSGSVSDWSKEEYRSETNLSEEEINKLVNVYPVCEDLEQIVLDVDAEWIQSLHLADLEDETGANHAKEDYRFISELKDADISVAKEISSQYEKYKKDYVGKTYLFQSKSDDNDKLEDTDKVLITSLAFKKKDDKKKLTADNIEPIVIVAVGEKGENDLKGYGTIKDIESGKKIYDVNLEDNTAEPEEDDDEYVVFSKDRVIWHHNDIDHTMKKKTWKYETSSESDNSYGGSYSSGSSSNSSNGIVQPGDENGEAWDTNDDGAVSGNEFQDAVNDYMDQHGY